MPEGRSYKTGWKSIGGGHRIFKSEGILPKSSTPSMVNKATERRLRRNERYLQQLDETMGPARRKLLYGVTSLIAGATGADYVRSPNTTSKDSNLTSELKRQLRLQRMYKTIRNKQLANTK
jgi:hypothetical protein